jgi:DNA-binding transcriptional LysR family regulator
MDPEIRLLRYFLAVAKELNFSRAAEQLHIAQPSLSAQIRQLEAQLGVQLLQRTTRSVSLTEAGRTLAQQGPAALAGVEQAWEAARATARGITGTLRLAYPLSAAHDTAPQLINALHTVHPRVEVASEVLPSPRVLAAVRDGRADIGIARAPAPDPSVCLTPLRHDRLVVLMSADHPLSHESSVSLTTVAGYPVVLHPRATNPSHFDYIMNLFAARGLEPTVIERDITFEFSQIHLVGTTGCTIIGRSTVEGQPENVRWVPLDEQLTLSVSLVTTVNGQTELAKRFQEVALNHAASSGWLVSGKH